MTDLSTNKPPIWFWIVSVIGLIWNGMGANQYLQQAYDTESYRAMYTPEQLEAAANMPAWLTAAFAIAVFAGVLGCIALLLKKKLASSLLTLSFLAVLVQMGYLITTGNAENMIMTAMILVFAIVLVWFARRSASKGWIS